MAAIAFDTLQFARRLIAAGVPEKQAETQAELMAEAFVYNIDSLATKDYIDASLDARFAAQDARIERRVHEQDVKFEQRFNEQDIRFEQRFNEQDTRFEQRFNELEASVGQRFHEQDARFEQRFNGQDIKFAEMRGDLKLHSWMLAILVASAVIPWLQKLYVILTG